MFQRLPVAPGSDYEFLDSGHRLPCDLAPANFSSSLSLPACFPLTFKLRPTSLQLQVAMTAYVSHCLSQASSSPSIFVHFLYKPPGSTSSGKPCLSLPHSTPRRSCACVIFKAIIVLANCTHIDPNGCSRVVRHLNTTLPCSCLEFLVPGSAPDAGALRVSADGLGQFCEARVSGPFLSTGKRGVMS